MLQPGQSATMPFRGVGSFRALAEVVEPQSPLSPRREVLATVELFFAKSDGGSTSLALAESFGGDRTYLCSHSDGGGGNGRLPD